MRKCHRLALTGDRTRKCRLTDHFALRSTGFTLPGQGAGEPKPKRTSRETLGQNRVQRPPANPPERCRPTILRLIWAENSAPLGAASRNTNTSKAPAPLPELQDAPPPPRERSLR